MARFYLFELGRYVRGAQGGGVSLDRGGALARFTTVRFRLPRPAGSPGPEYTQSFAKPGSGLDLCP